VSNLYDLYTKPDDMKRLEKMYPLHSSEFSINLIKVRYAGMDDRTKLIADKTIISLETGGLFDAKEKI
jgi:hypothetical protein